MGQGQSYCAVGVTYHEALTQLELVLRCYVDDSFRIQWVVFRDAQGVLRRKAVAIRGDGTSYDIIGERHPRNMYHGARVVL